jgi:fused signal recognition particle receptor
MHGGWMLGLEGARAWLATRGEPILAWLLAHPIEAAAAAALLLAALTWIALARRRRRAAPAEGLGLPAPAATAPAEALERPAPAAAAPPERLEPPAPAAAAPAEPGAAVPPAAEPVAAPPAPLSERLRRTRETLVGRLGRLIGDRRIDAELIEELEAALFAADLGVGTVESLLAEVRKRADGGDAAEVRRVLRESILAKLRRVEREPVPLAAGGPHVILVLGVNGSGKTTTIGKLAARFAREGRRVILGAGDTFRAAAVEQLQAWGARVGCEVIAGRAGGDPSAVAFDTVRAAVARRADVAIIDTAGRLQTRRPLMEELAKTARVIGRELAGAPHETLLVLDANTGQNAVSQAREFSEAAPVTGLVLTKLDGSAKGGVIVGLADEFAIPVRFVGVGESAEDLRDFSAEEFVEALFDA